MDAPCWLAISSTMGRPRPEPSALGAQRAVKGLEHQLALGRRNAGAGVFHLQHQHLAERVGQHARGDHAGLVGVDGV
jgi:hypothetical protein